MLYNFLLAQMEEPKKNDWVSSVYQDMDHLGIKMDCNEIESMKEDKFKQMCKERVQSMAFEFLQSKKGTHDKVMHIKYDSLKMAEYLRPNEFNISVKERQYIFQCRVSDIDVKANRSWKYEDTQCTACKDSTVVETGRHVLECKVLLGRNDNLSYIPDYNALFSKEIEEQIYTSRMMHKNMEIRKDYLKCV